VKRKRFWILIALSSVWALIYPDICGCTTTAEKASAIDDFVSRYVEYGRFNGSVLVAEGGEMIFKKGYGLANMEWNIPNQPSTKHRLGSITKQFTSMLIMQLVEEGKIDLQGTISDYLPEFRNDIGEAVTVHHLLTHTSGIPSYTSKPGFFKNTSRDPYAVDDFVKQYCSDDLEFEPGSKYSYNNSGYFILGAIIEEVTGKGYEEILMENILAPLGMNDTGYDHFDSIITNRATGYEKAPDGYVNAAYLDMSIPYAAGSMYSTVEDLYLWDQALYNNTLLSEKYTDIMFTPFLDNYAYGWGVANRAISESADSLEIISHDGGINGFNTLITRLVEDRHLIVLLNNTRTTALQGICDGIVNIICDQPVEPPKKPLSGILLSTISEQGIAAAVNQYHKLKEEYPDDYDYAESELNNLGYLLLSKGMVDEAIEIFRLNVEVYPDAFNVYDSLAEAYMKKGENELAIKNYAKSLEINPQNSSAIRMLNKIIKKK